MISTLKKKEPQNPPTKATHKKPKKPQTKTSHENL